MYPNQNRAAMFSVVMEQEDVYLLQKAAVETDLYTDTIAKLIGSQPDVIHQEGFSSYQLTITCNSRYGDMISLAFETENYVMTMSASVM